MSEARVIWIGVALAFLAAAALVVAIARPSLPWSSPSRAEEIRDAVDWPGDCADVTIDRPLDGDGGAWGHTEDAALIQCRMLGPAVIYARFDTITHRDQERFDGDVGYGWLREVSAGRHCYRQLTAEPLSGLAMRAGDRVRFTLVVDGTPRGAVTMPATLRPQRSASAARAALRRLGC